MTVSVNFVSIFKTELFSSVQAKTISLRVQKLSSLLPATLAGICASANGGELYEAETFDESRNEAIPGFYADELNNLGNIHFQAKSASDILSVFDLIIEREILTALASKVWKPETFLLFYFAPPFMKMILSSHFGASLCVMGLRSALVWANARHLYGLMHSLCDGGNRGG